MSHLELFFAAMYISEIWHSGYRDRNSHPNFQLYCRARAVVLFDRIITGQVTVQP